MNTTTTEPQHADCVEGRCSTDNGLTVHVKAHATLNGLDGDHIELSLCTISEPGEADTPLEFVIDHYPRGCTDIPAASFTLAPSEVQRLPQLVEQMLGTAAQ